MGARDEPPGNRPLTRPGTATAFSLRLRLHYKAAHAGSVKGLAPAVLGLVFGRGLAVVIGQNTAASQSQVLAGSSVLRLRGNPA